MKLVPYTYESKKRLAKQIHIIRVLLEGQSVWTEESVHSDPIRVALEPNDLYDRTDLTNMYTYRECDPDTTQLCWNTFHVITDERGNPFIDIPYPFLRTILKAHYVVPIENGASE